MSKKPNQSADVKNPNNPAYKAAVDNRSVQLNTKAAAAAITTVKIKTKAKK
jgi:hypothetical protein